MSDKGETIDFQLGVMRRIYGCWLNGRRINEVSEGAALALVHLTLVADDFGNLPGSPDALRALAFPRRKATTAKIQRWIDELATTKPPLVTVYEVRGDRYLHIEAPDGRSWDKLQPTRNGKRFQKYPEQTPSGESKREPGNPKHPKHSSAALSPVAPYLKLALSPEHEAGNPTPNRQGSDGAEIYSASDGASGPEPEDRVLLHFARHMLSSARFPWGVKTEIHPDAIETVLRGRSWSLESIWLALARVAPKHTDPVGYVLAGAESDWTPNARERSGYAAWYEKTVKPTMDRVSKAAERAAGGAA